MGHLLATRLSLDAYQWKQVSDFEMALCQNKAETMEAISEAKAHCGAIVKEAEAHYSADIRGVEAQCFADIREAESHCAEHTCSIQQLHAEGMEHLEMEAMEEEGETTSPS